MSVVRWASSSTAARRRAAAGGLTVPSAASLTTKYKRGRRRREHREFLLTARRRFRNISPARETPSCSLSHSSLSSVGRKRLDGLLVRRIARCAPRAVAWKMPDLASITWLPDRRHPAHAGAPLPHLPSSPSAPVRRRRSAGAVAAELPQAGGACAGVDWRLRFTGARLRLIGFSCRVPAACHLPARRLVRLVAIATSWSPSSGCFTDDLDRVRLFRPDRRLHDVVPCAEAARAFIGCRLAGGGNRLWRLNAEAFTSSRICHDRRPVSVIVVYLLGHPRGHHGAAELRSDLLGAMPAAGDRGG